MITSSVGIVRRFIRFMTDITLTTPTAAWYTGRAVIGRTLMPMPGRPFSFLLLPGFLFNLSHK